MKRITLGLSLALCASIAHGQFWRETIVGASLPTCNFARLGWGYQVSDATVETSCAAENFGETGNDRKLALCVCAWTAGVTAFEWQALTRGEGGGGGTPGGADTQVQYNDSGAFGGDAGLTFNETSNVLTATGGFVGDLTGTASVAATGDSATAFFASGSIAAARLTPAGSDTQLQFNDSGALAGDSGLTFIGSTNALAVTGSVTSPTIYGGSLTGNTLSLFGNPLNEQQQVIVGSNTSADAQLHIRSNSSSELILRKAVGSYNTVSFYAGSTRNYVIYTDPSTDMYISGDGRADIRLKPSKAGVTITGILALNPQASPPGTPATGDIYLDTSLALCFYDGTSWQVLNPSTVGVGTCA